MPTTKTELALKTKEELIEEILGLSDEKEKLKKRTPQVTSGDITQELVKALQIIARQGTGPERPIDTTPQGYKVQPPMPINAMLPIQKVKWRLENNQAFLDAGGEKPEIITERNRLKFVWQKKFVELFEQMQRDPDMADFLKLDAKYSKTPDPEGKIIGFNLKGYYDEIVVTVNKKIAERKKADAKYNMPIQEHVYK